LLVFQLADGKLEGTWGLWAKLLCIAVLFERGLRLARARGRVAPAGER
jgi:hypothetical protein